MASRGFFGFDPFDDYYTSPSNYTNPYFHNPNAFEDFLYTAPPVRQPSPYSYYHGRPASARPPARNQGGDPRPKSSKQDCFEIPVTGPDPEPKKTAAPCAPPANAAAPKKSAPSAEEAAVTMQAAVPKKSAEEAAVTVQAAARGLLARKMVRQVRAVEREAEVVAARIAAEAEALRADQRMRIGVGEELMRLVLRLDAVRGVREYRRRVTKKVLALQDAVDALEAKPALAADTPAAAEPLAAETVEMAEADGAVESEMAPELPQTGEQGVQIEDNIAADSSATAEVEMDVDSVKAEVDSVKAEEAATEAIAVELVDEQAAAEVEGEWEMVAGDDDFADEPKAQEQEATVEEPEKKKTEAATGDGLDAKKVMDMMAVLCERSAQQCQLIRSLVERVDKLEHTVQRMEDADRRRRKIKKIKEGKSNSKNSFYSD